MKIEEMEQFAPGGNPYREDLSRTGAYAGNKDGWHVMWESWDQDTIVLVHRESGKRVRLIPDNSVWELRRKAELEAEDAIMKENAT